MTPVVVDEASMLDLALAAKLFDALRGDARLILLGDKDQLASVESGAIFGAICAAGPAIDRGEDYAAQSMTPGYRVRRGAEGAVTLLEQSYRFAGESGNRTISALRGRGRCGRRPRIAGRGRAVRISRGWRIRRKRACSRTSC
jgi:exodeoxyribonuclease V alpha subunit